MEQSAFELSVVIPVYKAQEMLEELVKRLEDSLRKCSPDYEIVLVNDSSPDGSWEKILSLCQLRPRVKGIQLSRNFGQHKAIHAGLCKASGEWVVVMDCDLQDQPEEIEALYKKAKSGFPIVFALRQNRKDSFLKKFFSKSFYSTLSFLTDSQQDARIANFGIYNKKVIHAVLEMGDFFRYFPTMVRWVGFKSTAIEVQHSERHSGKTSYSFFKLLSLASNIILSFSEKPLRLVIQLGLMISFSSLLISAYFIWLYVRGEIVVLGFASLIISIWLLSGVIISVLGMVGLYVGRTFEQSKNRPRYIVSDSINL